jgi:hypothetical protein
MLDLEKLKEAGIELTVDSIYKNIISYGIEFQECLYHGNRYGINIDLTLDYICTKMETLIFPAISKLSEEEQRLLLEKLKELYKVHDDKIHPTFITKSMECIKDCIVEGKNKR